MEQANYVANKKIANKIERKKRAFQVTDKRRYCIALLNVFISPAAAQRKRILTLKILYNRLLNTNYYHLKELLKKTRNREKKNEITAPVTVTLPDTVHKSTDQQITRIMLVLVAY